MTVAVFLFIACGNLTATAWHVREFWLHAQQKRLKLAQFVLFTQPLGWVAFCAREWKLMSLPVASVALAFAVFGTGLHLAAIYSQMSQRRPS